MGHLNPCSNSALLLAQRGLGTREIITKKRHYTRKKSVKEFQLETKIYDKSIEHKKDLSQTYAKRCNVYEWTECLWWYGSTVFMRNSGYVNQVYDIVMNDIPRVVYMSITVLIYCTIVLGNDVDVFYVYLPI